MSYTNRAAPSTGDRPVDGSVATGLAVLLVDDDGMVRDMTARILKRGGHRVTAIESGDAALRHLTLASEAEIPDVVLTDMSMPGMSGGDLGKAIAARWPDLSVVFMSGYPVESFLRNGTIDRTQSFLAKPFTAETLLGTIGRDRRPPG